MPSRLKLPINYRSAASRTPTPEDIHVEGGIALLAEAPADPGDVSTPMVVTVNGGARSRVTTTPAAGQYMARTATSPQGIAWLPVLEFHSSDEGLDGTCDYYRTGTVYTAEWFTYLLSFMAPITGLASHAALDAFAPPSLSPTALGRPGRMAFLNDFSAWYSDGTAWRQISGTSVVTAADMLYGAVFGASQDAIASHVGATAFGATLGAVHDASWSPPGALAGSITADAILGALLDAVFTSAGLTGDFTAGVTLSDARDASYAAAGGVNVSDNFNRADGTLGANWTRPTGWLGAPSDVAVYQNTAQFPHMDLSWDGELFVSTPAGAAYTGATFAANQYAEIKLDPSLIDYYTQVGVGVRIQLNGTTAVYATYWKADTGNAHHFDIGKIESGAADINTSNVAAVEYASGQLTFPLVLRLEASGDVFSMKRAPSHGGAMTTMWSGTIAGFGTGRPGLVSVDWGMTTGVQQSRADDFYAGDL